MSNCNSCYFKTVCYIREVRNDSDDDDFNCPDYKNKDSVTDIVKAKWIPETKNSVIKVDGIPYTKTTQTIICSNCRKDKYENLDADLWSDWDIDYCPHCGAKIIK